MTSIQTYCKVKTNTKCVKLSDNELLCQPVNTPFKFTQVFDERSTNEEIYIKLHEDLLRYFFTGYNSCLVISGGDKSYEEFFDGGNGFLSYLLENISKQLKKYSESKENQIVKRKSKEVLNNEITMKIFDVYEYQLNDLLLLRSSVNRVINSATIHIVEDDFDGIVVKNADEHIITETSSIQAISVLKNALQNTSFMNKLHEEENTVQSFVVEFELNKTSKRLKYPLTSWFRVVFVSPDSLHNSIFMRAKPGNQEDLVSTTSIPTFSSISSSCMLSKLLTDPLNGNCVTKAIMFVSFQETDTILFECFEKLKGFQTYPVDNSPRVKGLLRCYRENFKQLEQDCIKEKKMAEAYEEKLNNEIECLKESNEKLTMLNKQYEQEIDKTISSKSNAATSTMNEVSTVERLKMAKEAVDLKLFTNRLQQDFEEQLYKLRQKALSEEKKLATVQRSLAYEHKLNTELRSEMERMNNNQEEMLEEYSNLRRNYDIVYSKYQKQMNVNSDLNETVLKLSDLKDQLMYQNDDLQCKQIQDFDSHLLKLKNILNEKETTKLVENPSLLSTKTSKIESDFSSPNKVNLDVLHKKQTADLKLLEQMLCKLKDDISVKDEQISTFKRKFASLTTKMLLVSEEKKILVSCLHEKHELATKLSSEYRARLEQYIRDLSNFFSTTKDVNNTKIIQNMVDDLKSSFGVDLTQEQKKYTELKTISEAVLEKHEKLLIAHRLVLHECKKELREDTVLNYEILLPTESEIQASLLKKETELRTKLLVAEERVKDLEDKVEVCRYKIRELEQAKFGDVSTFNDEDSWHNVHRQIRNFTSSVQRNLEKDKAELLTRCNLAEEQLKTYHDVMHQNKQRYEFELQHLRGVLHDYSLKLNLQRQQQEPDRAGFLPAISHYKHFDTR